MNTYSGTDLLRLGCPQGRLVGELLAIVNDGHHDQDDVRRLIADNAPPPALPLRASAAPCDFYIDAASEQERANVAAVRATMDAVLRTPVAVKGLIMPDACPTGSTGTIPVGGVVTLDNAIAPGMHSADICCSVMMSVFDDADPGALLDTVGALTHFGPGGRGADAWAGPDLHEDLAGTNRFLHGQQMAQAMTDHFGTQGDGNHFVFVGTLASTGQAALVTHHGSRKPGALLYKAGMKLAETCRRTLSPETLKQNAWIPADSEDGIAYWEALQAIREWTRRNHLAIHDRTRASGGWALRDRVFNEHNFVFRQGNLFHHAKGATPLEPSMVPGSDGRMLVPLNMASPVLVIRGAERQGFAPHGAGRNMSRTCYKRQLEADGVSEAEALMEQTAGIDARWHSGRPDVSELPGAYKDAAAVQEQMQRFGLADVVDRVMPYGSIMAGDWEHDAPWVKKRCDRTTARRAAR